MHIQQDLRALSELARVLRSRGRAVVSINNFASPWALPVQLWNLRKRGFVQKFRFLPSFRRQLRKLRLEPASLKGDGISSTVNVEAGRLSFPPASLFRPLRSLDAHLLRLVPGLAYEVWLAAEKR